LAPGLTVIAGLGNPEREYKNTRHNIGFEVINKLSYDYDIPIKRAKFRAHFGEGELHGNKVLLAKPQTYMNLSGECIRDILKFYKLTPGNLIVIYDDADLFPGEIRVREKGSAGTHNGMKNIIYQLETDEIRRVRVGIGKSGRVSIRDFVLGKIKKGEADDLIRGVTKAAEAVGIILTDGPAAAMNKYNVKLAAPVEKIHKPKSATSPVEAPAEPISAINNA